ncbi:MAG: GNAT family N-acetyltransferase [Gemmataceae bacterium]|nr:GNAT family N-acetyltransferase [Gemmataceae bacterium]
MTAATSTVTSIAAAEADRAIAVLALAFSADPVNRWVWPHPDQYLAGFPAFARAFGGASFQHGTAHCAEEGVGAALWLPPGAQTDEDAVVEVLRATAPEEHLDDLMEVLDRMSGYHPAGPHWYLPLIGVDPAHRGRGVGSRLLQHALNVCDQDGTPAYLESSNRANIPLYERHGFEVVGTIRVGTCPPLFPMVRPARGRAA